MSDEALRLNIAYLNEMNVAPLSTVLGKIRDLWWAPFLEGLRQEGPKLTLNKLDAFMSPGRERMVEMATAHADADAVPGTDRHRLLATQFLKSNTGKMFERFVGLALAQCLVDVSADYCVLPFRAREISRMSGLQRDDFRVDFVFGEGSLFTHVDADMFAFNPTDPDADVFMISVKSTLKDRFHNVPFWNLLRRAAVSHDFEEIVPGNRDFLARVRYVAVCSDLAEEQPDFATEAGARNLLQVDASLLDGAYVSASRARGLPDDCTDSLGDVRKHAFYRYSCFYERLTS